MRAPGGVAMTQDPAHRIGDFSARRVLGLAHVTTPGEPQRPIGACGIPSISRGLFVEPRGDRGIYATQQCRLQAMPRSRPLGHASLTASGNAPSFGIKNGPFCKLLMVLLHVF